METAAIRFACARLCDDFAHFVDHRDYQGLVALFTEDGTFTRNGTTLCGHAEILSAMRARSPEIETRHLCTNVRIDVRNSHEASGTCYLLLLRSAGVTDQAPAPPVFAEFHDVFRATAQGWRIASRTIVVPF